ncbi:MAG: DUF736 domain-containing protein [Novosphingobium sp.]
MQIGQFQMTRDGFEGHLHSLTLDMPVCLVPASPSDAENAPDWRLLRGDADTGIEIGAGWNRTGERAGAYVAVQFDDPTFSEPVRANLLRFSQGHSDHVLLWTRPISRERR